MAFSLPTRCRAFLPGAFDQPALPRCREEAVDPLLDSRVARDRGTVAVRAGKTRRRAEQAASQAARRRLRADGVLVADFAESRKHGPRHLATLDEAFAGRVHWGTLPGGYNHMAFAFADADCAVDWVHLEERAAALAEQFPLDFSAIVHSLRDGGRTALSQGCLG